MTDPDYQRQRPPEGIRDIAEDAQEALDFFKKNRARLERLLDFAERAVDAFDGSWLCRMLGIKPKR